MSDNFIRNREGKIINRWDGNWLRDGTGRLVARYDESDDRTRDRNGKVVGDGDLRLFQLGKDQTPKRETPPRFTVNGPDKTGSDRLSTAGR